MKRRLVAQRARQKEKANVYLRKLHLLKWHRTDDWYRCCSLMCTEEIVLQSFQLQIWNLRERERKKLQNEIKIMIFLLFIFFCSVYEFGRRARIKYHSLLLHAIAFKCLHFIFILFDMYIALFSGLAQNTQAIKNCKSRSVNNQWNCTMYKAFVASDTKKTP